jgi:secreted PhoX family phosphatase
MNDRTPDELLADADDIGTNVSNNPTLEQVLNARLNRRSILKGSFGIAATTFFGTGLSACGGSLVEGPVERKTLKLNFNAVAKSLADALTVPAGYTATVLLRLGDPITAGVAEYRNDGTEIGASFEQRAGDHHDGMHYFGLGDNGRFNPGASDRGLLCMNHEAITASYLHAAGQTTSGSGTAAIRPVQDEVIKEMNAHGVSVIEVSRSSNRFTYKKDSSFNRRITTLTEMDLSGPAARSPMMITAYSTDGSKTRGTVNNCANGHTPWGTYLTCEENWAGFFRRIVTTDDLNRTAKELVSFARYGIAGNGGKLWATATPSDGNDTRFARWNAMKTGSSLDGRDDFRNVANTYGWVVEIDPFNPTSIPKKRTGLGRMAHEGAWPGAVVPGRPLVWYMGCDSRNEYIYKYVSNAVWDPADATRGLVAGDKYLDDGKLYVAKFNADGSGEWIELKFGSNNITTSNATYAFSDQADVLINTRLAADAAGGTKMDRPEWGAVNPLNGEVYMTLTNSSTRTLASTDAANPRFYNDPKGPSATAQNGNPNGHIIRWAENGSNVAATGFRWDVFLFGARSTADANNINVSNLTAANDFSSPDGLWFARNGLLWIQTDDGAFTDVTNCMMLAAVPGKVGDGSRKTIRNVDGTNTRSVDTHVGVAPGDTNLRRFLVGPKECEITGITETPDGRALFVNIQHPGEDAVPTYSDPTTFGSHWPDGGSARPRSATVVITKDDGGEVGGGLAN